jgi:hypothetical protein
MDLLDQTVIRAQSAQRSRPVPDQPCALCAEQIHLKTLVAELLYKNQVLRFDLQDAQERLARAERDHRKHFSERI